MLLTACSDNNFSVDNSSDSSTISSENELSEPEKSSSESRLSTIADGVYTTYDKSKYDNIYAPKIYHADFQEISENFFFNLFSSEPKYFEEDGYITENECARYKAPTENSAYYNLTYYTTTGFDSSALAANCFPDYSTSANLDFMPIDEVRTEFEKLTLVYISIYSSGELLLTPAWEFSYDFGPLYRINAYTGEEIR